MEQEQRQREGKGAKWVTHYSSDHQILLVGEGDFSFSLSLARSFGSAANIVASSLDSYDDLNKKYKQAKSNLDELQKLGACLLHGVDATKMKFHSFDRVIFNFPHAGFRGKEDDLAVIKMHKDLVLGFFKNASQMLTANGEIHVNHKTSAPFNKWDIEELAMQSFLILIERAEFHKEDYPGYNNKRGDGCRCDEPFPLGKCSTFKFIHNPYACYSSTHGMNPGSQRLLQPMQPLKPMESLNSFHPWPTSTNVRYSQINHVRTMDIAPSSLGTKNEGYQEKKLLKSRHVFMEPPVVQIHEHLQQAGFNYVARICQMEINRYLISALVERWRTETHTFHFPCGECSITLEDVAIVLGLRIEGLPVIGSTNGKSKVIRNMCKQLLGGRPGPTDVVAGKIKFDWLTTHLNSLSYDTTERIAYHARGYILSMLGHFLIPNKSTNTVHGKFLSLLENLEHIGLYSWGSACLSALYDGLDHASRHNTKEVTGCTVLLQVWAWQRLPWLAPLPTMPFAFPLAMRWKHYRYPHNTPYNDLHNIRLALDQMQFDQFVWQSYQDPAIDGHIPDDVRVERPLWSTVSPLICFEIIEWHAADRVMRQFGFDQPIPSPPHNLGASHNKDLRGRKAIDWRQKHQEWVTLWESRHDRLLQGQPTNNYVPSNDYRDWYIQYARNWFWLSPQVQQDQPIPHHQSDQAFSQYYPFPHHQSNQAFLQYHSFPHHQPILHHHLFPHQESNQAFPQYHPY